jgi:hypothetical protein
MTLGEHKNLSETDKAFLKLEGRCTGCGCDLKGMFNVHSEWCEKSPAFIWRTNPDVGWRSGEMQIMSSGRRQGKSVFANMVNQLNKLFGKENENTNSR